MYGNKNIDNHSEIVKSNEIETDDFEANYLEADDFKANEELSKTLIKVFDNTVRDMSGKELYEDLLSFFREIIDKVLAGDYHLVVLMARKAWCLYHVLEPLLMERREPEDRIKINESFTHDGMLAPYFNNLSSNTGKTPKEIGEEIKVAIVDDFCTRGRTVSKCARRLCKVFEVVKENVTFHAYVVWSGKVKDLFPEGIDSNKFRVLAKYPEDMDKGFIINWHKGNRNRKIIRGTVNDYSEITFISRSFIEAIHVSSTPYVSFNVAFIIDLREAEGIFSDFSKSDDDYLQQENLREPFKNPKEFEFYNITSQPMYQNNVEAFALYPTERNSCLEWKEWKWLPFYLSGWKKLSSPCIRVYVNKNNQKVLLVPHMIIPSIEEGTEIGKFFPSDYSGLFCNGEIETPEGVMEKIYEGTLAAYRLLSNTVSYLFGLKFLDIYGKNYTCAVENIIIKQSISLLT